MSFDSTSLRAMESNDFNGRDRKKTRLHNLSPVSDGQWKNCFCSLIELNHSVIFPITSLRLCWTQIYPEYLTLIIWYLEVKISVSWIFMYSLCVFTVQILVALRQWICMLVCVSSHAWNTGRQSNLSSKRIAKMWAWMW